MIFSYFDDFYQLWKLFVFLSPNIFHVLINESLTLEQLEIYTYFAPSAPSSMVHLLQLMDQ